MRIIGGTHKRIRIDAPKNLPLRPTTDFARETLFNVLEHSMDLSSLRVIDLFSGTGAISFEFVSRGAMEILAVDRLPQALLFTRKKAQELGFVNIKTLKSDALRFLAENNTSADLIFADPPFDFEQYNELISKVLQSQSLKPGGLFIVEHSSRNDFSEREWFLKKKTCGAISFSFFTKSQA
jgi:16S rRNA (guanine966-N2)-methyltransferase